MQKLENKNLPERTKKTIEQKANKTKPKKDNFFFKNLSSKETEYPKKNPKTQKNDKKSKKNNNYKIFQKNR